MVSFDFKQIMFNLLVLVFLSVSKVLGDCGPPVSHPDLYTRFTTGVAKEGGAVAYICKMTFLNLRVAYSQSVVRHCTKDKWSGRMPKCGEYVFI